MEPVLFDIDGRGVATITLNRPKRLNAVTMAMRDLLWTYLEACADTPDVSVIAFKGEGRCFSAGAEISEFGTAPSIMEARRARLERDVWGRLLTHRCATIAVMHGYCYGAGLELPLCCDVRVAEEGATFALPEVSLAYIPSAGGTQTLPRLIPPGIAAQMVLTGEPVGTAEALRWGLVDRAAPVGSLASVVEEEVARILSDPAGAMARRRAWFANA